MLELGRLQHNERWGEPAPAAGDVELLHKQLRYQAYRQYALWWWGTLGRSQRRVIPACVVCAVRRAHPSPQGFYVGFNAIPM
ncbi:P2X purinoceptor 7-like [Amphibalanus amphitrite]|nr:P2X purinoceptor 7-like [Amphibalanus amphitrite]XP_043221947.1 P2X purinoceptor 7-like [Amphibalanus amphitrite]